MENALFNHGKLLWSTLVLVSSTLGLMMMVRSRRNKKVETVDSIFLMEKYATRAEIMMQRMSGKRMDIRRNYDPKYDQDIIITNRQEQTQEQQQREGMYLEPSKLIPVFEECDILVCGGGPSGISAALAAKRAGAEKVILMEKFGCFGGVITTAGCETVGWYRYEGTYESNGIGLEMERIAAKMGGTTKFPYNNSENLDADFFKVVADHLIKEAGVIPLLHSFAVEVVKEGNVIVGVIFESKSGRQLIRAKRVIDCTGDADIAYFAGADFRLNPIDRRLGLTTVLNLSGVNKSEFLDYVNANPATYADWSRIWFQETTGKENHLPSPYLDKEFEKARNDGVMPKDMTHIGGSWSSLTEAGEATNLNIIHLQGYDCTNVRDLTQAEMKGRSDGLYAIQAMRAILPGFQHAKLRNFGMTIGTRDSRKIIGRYNLTGDDVRNQAKFEDSIGIFPEFIDGYAILILPTTGRYFQVPYGCLVPDGDLVENLLVAGRAVAGDNVSHAAMRNMMACTVTGQGAGAAAAVSIKENSPITKVNIKSVQAELLRQGVTIF